MQKYILCFRIITFLSSLFFLAASSPAQDLFLSVSGKKANAALSGDDVHSYEYWLRPERGAGTAALQIFDAGLGGIADVVSGLADTKTAFEIFPVEALYPKGIPGEENEQSNAKPIASFQIGSEPLYINRWNSFAALHPAESPAGWILRVSASDGNDINSFQLALTDTSSLSPRSDWSIIALDLSVCLFHVSPDEEVQLVPFETPPIEALSGKGLRIVKLNAYGLEDAQAIVRDDFGNTFSLTPYDSAFEATMDGMKNHWGIAISGSAMSINNLVIKGAARPVLWEVKSVIVQRPKTPSIEVKQLPAQSCTAMRFALDDATRKAFVGITPQWIFHQSEFATATVEGDSTTYDFQKPGMYSVSVLLPTRGMYFPKFWKKDFAVKVSAGPTAVITSDKYIVAPGEQIICSSEQSSDPENRPLRTQWYVNGEFRGEGKTLRIASLIPGKYTVKLVVSNGAMNSVCTEATDTKVVRINAQPYAEINYPLVFGRLDTAVFSVKNAVDNDGDLLRFDWSGPGIAGKASGHSIKIEHNVAGDYQLTLRVSDQTGTSNSTYSKTITYHVNAEPVPVFSLPAQAAPGDTIMLSASRSVDPDNTSLAYTWTTTAGVHLAGREVKTTFDAPGDYKVVLTVNDNENVSNSIRQIAKDIHINAPPVPVITAEDRSTSAKQIFSADRSSDADQSRLAYTWDFGDGHSDTGKVVTHFYAASGHYRITLTVNDLQKQTNSVQEVSHELVINRYPVAEFSLPKVWQPGKPLSLDGSKSYDPDGTVSRYAWMMNGKKFSGDSVASVTFNAPGDYAIALRVKDNSGFDDAVGIKTIPIHVNYPPVVRWKMIPSVAEPNVPVTFDASESYDPDGAAIKKVAWTFSDGTTAEGVRVAKTFKASGIVSVMASADDGSGFTNAVQTKTENILVNTPPIIVTKTLIRTNSRRIHLDASASYDADGDALSLDWMLPDGTHVHRTSFYWDAPSGGVQFITLTADDGHGKKNSIVRETIRVLVNRPPVAVVDSLIYSCTGQTILFNGSSSYDPDGDPISTQWDFRDGATSTETNPAHVYAKPGYYEVKLSLDDGFAEHPTIATIPVIVEGSPAAYQTFSDTTVCVNVPLAFNGDRSTDPNGPIGSFAWDFGDGITAVGSNVTHSYTKAGTYYAVLTVIGNGSGRCSKTSQATSTIHVVEGPVADFSPPARVSIGEDVALDASPSRPNGKIISEVWRIQNDSQSILLNGHLAHHSFKTSGTYAVTLIITVESTASCNTATMTKKIQVNHPPVLAWNVPKDIPFGDPLVLDASQSYDPDGIITAFRWEIDGKIVASTPRISVAALAPGNHSVSLTITDNSHTSSASVSQSAAVFVNSKPNPSFTLPDQVFENETVQLSPSATVDADGDTLQFTWKIDDAVIGNAAVKFTPGRHTITLIASDLRNLLNSVDSVQKEIYVIAAPELAVSHPADWIVGTTVRVSEFYHVPFVGFTNPGGGTNGNQIENSWIPEKSGEMTEEIAWAPKGEILAAKDFHVTVWDSLKFTGQLSEKTITWNPSNPSLILSAPLVNRPEARNVLYEWRKGAQAIGVGKIIEAPLTKGRNVFTVKAIDQDMQGAVPIEQSIVVNCVE
ncbi:MAG: PKD domain-containing protein [Bacteroidota bacterium]|nr:PKD domain-containing protein [Bacteroidota bacterium]